MGSGRVELHGEYGQGLLACIELVWPGLADDRVRNLLGCRRAVPVPGGVVRRFLSEWTAGCNDTLVSEASKQDCQLPSVRHKTAVTVILLEYY